MKVDLYTGNIYRVNNKNNKYSSDSITNTSKLKPSNPNSNSIPQSYPAVYFCGAINFAKLNANKKKLIDNLTEILKENIEESASPEERFAKLMKDALNTAVQKAKKRKKLEEKAKRLHEDKTLNPQQKCNIARQLRKEFKNLSKPSKISKEEPKKASKMDPKTDFILLEKFRNALLDGNFDLFKVYKEYYSKLNSINTLEELKEAYPLLPLPKNPIDVISNKIYLSFPAEMYKKINTLIDSGDHKKAREYITKQITDAINETFNDKTPTQKEKIFKKLFAPIYEKVSNLSEHIYTERNYSAVPNITKKITTVNDIDKKMIDIDYEDFVIDILKKQYHEIQKRSDIIYEKDGVKINLSSLSNSDYKLEPMSPKVKKIMIEARNIRDKERNYDLYPDVKSLQDRMLYYSINLVSNNKRYVSIMDEFDTCQFTPEDTEKLKILLRKTDEVFDGETTIEDALRYLHKNSIAPTGTRRLNELEQQRLERERQAQQKAAKALKREKELFDNAIDELYKIGLIDIAQKCSMYRPTSMNKNEIENAKFIIETITKNLSKENYNPNIIERIIDRWSKYPEYAELDPDSDIFKAAIKFATDEQGNIDKIKAGKYIINAEALMAYPESEEFASNPDIVKLIVNELGNGEQAIRALCRYDDYIDMTAKNKTFIRKIVSIFNKHDETDRKILNEIMQNDYIKVDTVDFCELDNSGNNKVKVTITPNAKSALYNRYTIKSLKFFEAFEEAMQHKAPETGSSGVKYIGKNNKKRKGIHELKIKGNDDRLISYDYSYYFDEYSPTGLH